MFKKNYIKREEEGKESGALPSQERAQIMDILDSAKAEKAGETPPPVPEAKADGPDYKALFEAQKVEQEKTLTELKAQKQKITDAQSQVEKDELDTARAEGNTEKILEITQRELEKFRQRDEDMTSKESERIEKSLLEAKTAKFLEALGSPLHNPADIKDARLDLVIQNDDGSWNTEGLAQAVEDYRTNYGYRVKSSTTKLDQGAAQGAETKQELSFADRMKKAGSIIG